MTTFPQNVFNVKREGGFLGYKVRWGRMQPEPKKYILMTSIKVQIV